MREEFSRTANEKDDRHNETIKAPHSADGTQAAYACVVARVAAVAGIIAGAVLMLLFG